MGEWTTASTLSLAAGETVTVRLSDRANGYVIADAVRLVRTDAARNRLTWPLDVQVAGEYRLEARWTSHPNRASNATYVVETAAGPQSVTVNQRQGGGVWQPLGTFALDDTSQVVLTDEADGFVVADGIRVVWADTPGNQQALASSGSQIVYFHNDHLGTPQVITDANQEIVWQGDYLPFGEVTPSVAAIENPVRFPGQYFDEETGTYYNYFRDYDSSTGRYIQSDVIGIRGGFATYGYALHRPIMMADPSGAVPVVVAACAASPAACAAVVSTVAYAASKAASAIYNALADSETFPRPGAIPGTTEHRGELDTPSSIPAPPGSGPDEDCVQQAEQNYQSCLSGCRSAAEKSACRAAWVRDVLECQESGGDPPNPRDLDGPDWVPNDDYPSLY